MRVFLGLALVYGVLVALAQLAYPDNLLVNTLLYSLGSAVLGAGLAFFLIEVMERGSMHGKLWEVVTVFLGLAVAFGALVLTAQLLFAADLFAYTVVVTTAAGMFGGGLTFFLVEMVRPGR